jgi:hypothetical protein
VRTCERAVDYRNDKRGYRRCGEPATLIAANGSHEFGLCDGHLTEMRENAIGDLLQGCTVRPAS